jgi:glycosyltransferase involved in cell wall biosynthesis
MPSPFPHIPIFHFPIGRPGMSRGKRLTRLLEGWARVPALLACLSPDIVHLHSLPVPAATPFLLTVRNLVVSAWGSDVVWRDRRKVLLYPFLLARAARVTATSQYLAGVVRTYLRRSRSIDIVAFGVDTAQFSPAPQRPLVPYIGTVRGLEPKYGIDVLIESLPRVFSYHPSVEVDIAGEGPQREALQRRIADLGIEDRVHLHGQIAHADVPAFLRSLSIFVNPSRQESFGVAAAEAQACGLPVVATNVGGLPEVVLDGKTGALVPPEDPEALASTLAAFLASPEWCSRLGAAGRQWIVERYRWETNVDQMVRIYEEVQAGG